MGLVEQNGRLNQTGRGSPAAARVAKGDRGAHQSCLAAMDGGHHMKVYITDDLLSAGDLSAQWIIEAHQAGARRFGLATGQTMIPVYRALVDRIRAEPSRLDVAAWETFNLDEYVGISADHPGSFHHFMEEHLFSHINLERSRTHVLNGQAPDLEAECLRYENEIECARLEFQLLGIGMNGHIGFNEPGTPWNSRTHKVHLSEETLEQNRPSFPGEMPREALTMGIASILRAETIVVVAIGASKANAVLQAITGPPDVLCPASALQQHRSVRYVLDRAAAKGLLASREIFQQHEIIGEF